MLNKIVLTKKSVKIGAALIALIIIGIGANFVILPAITDIETVNASLASEEEAVTAAEAKVSSLQQAEANYEAISDINSSLVTQFPETGQSQQLFDMIILSAAQAGLTPESISSINVSPPSIQEPVVPVAPEPTEDEAPAEGDGVDAAAEPAPEATTELGGGYGTMEISLSVVGSSTQVANFLNNLNAAPRAFIISAISVTAEGESGVSVSFTGTAFIYEPIPSPAEIMQQAQQAQNAATSDAEAAPVE